MSFFRDQVMQLKGKMTKEEREALYDEINQ